MTEGLKTADGKRWPADKKSTENIMGAREFRDTLRAAAAATVARSARQMSNRIDTNRIEEKNRREQKRTEKKRKQAIKKCTITKIRVEHAEMLAKSTRTNTNFALIASHRFASHRPANGERGILCNTRARR